MKRLHDQEKKQFKKLFKQERIADFENRLIVLEAFLQTEKHVTVAELMVLLNENGHRLGHAHGQKAERCLAEEDSVLDGAVGQAEVDQ